MSDVDLDSLAIIPFPHPGLRIQARPIVRVDEQLRQIAARMLDLMYETNGVGLAATQINLPIRMFVLNPSGDREENEQEMILINPVIQRPKGSDTSQEGCLSLPGVHGDVKRPKSVHLHAYTIQGQAVDQVFDGFIARVMQHENDHLDGILFFDRMSGEPRLEIDDQLAELDGDFRHRQRAGEFAADDVLLADFKIWHERYT